MSPCLRQLVRILAIIAVEDARAREARRQDPWRVPEAEALTPIPSRGNVAEAVSGNPSKPTRTGREADG